MLSSKTLHILTVISSLILFGCSSNFEKFSIPLQTFENQSVLNIDVKSNTIELNGQKFEHRNDYFSALGETCKRFSNKSKKVNLCKRNDSWYKVNEL